MPRLAPLRHRHVSATALLLTLAIELLALIGLTATAFAVAWSIAQLLGALGRYL